MAAQSLAVGRPAGQTDLTQKSQTDAATSKFATPHPASSTAVSERALAQKIPSEISIVKIASPVDFAEPPSSSPPPLAHTSPPQAPRSSLKRKHNDMDGSELNNPTKRTVTFSTNIETQEDPNTVRTIRKEVRYALEAHSIGETEPFEQLKEYFGTNDPAQIKKRPSPDKLKIYVAALASNVALLRRPLSSLVHAVLDSEWVGQDDEYVAAYVAFLSGLVSSHGIWLYDTLHMLVGKFAAGHSSASAVSNATKQSRVHAALHTILRLVPSASNVLGDTTSGRLSLLAACFPHPSDTRQVHLRYVQGLFQLITYAPELQAAVLTLITERVVKIDVQVQVDFEDLADDIGDELLANLRTAGEDEIEESDPEDSDDDMDEDELPSDESRLKSIQANLGKLDTIMHQLFTFYDRAFSQPGSADAAAAAEILLSHFRKLVLPTYRSRHTQFLLFHFMQTTPALVDSFLGACVSLVLDKRRPPMLRQSAATYLASFVARGLHVPRDITREVFSFIADQLTLLRHQYEPDCHGPDPRRYHTYYALVQALLYIFCFRWRDLATDDSDTDPEPASHLDSAAATVAAAAAASSVLAVDDDDELHVTFPTSVTEALAQNVFSPLNPLRICAPAIAAEFVDTARKLRAVYAHHVLATNVRVRVLPVSVGSSGRSTPTPAAPEPDSATLVRRDEAYARVCLDGYFPFDPYRLPGSARWVEGDYREWQGVGEDDDESEDSEDDEDEEEDEAMGTETEDEGDK